MLARTMIDVSKTLSSIQLVTEVAGSGIAELAIKAEKIEGYLSPKEGAALYACALYGPASGDIVEIGSWKGKSTVWLASAAKKGQRGKVHAIDPHVGSDEHQPGGDFHKDLPQAGSTFQEFQQNINSFGLNDWVIPHLTPSQEAARSWQGDIRLLFIDGDHSFEAVKADFQLFSPYVSTGGVIAFHDVYAQPSTWSGPIEVIQQVVEKDSRFSPVHLVGGMYLTMKIG
ncbi:MAG: class I SAM-dependent methyltransferase [Bdellovibrionales bacterium]|nr:class I SAM-dependent methyltransferase [Bdellovibrionales bacterium]